MKHAALPELLIRLPLSCRAGSDDFDIGFLDNAYRSARGMVFRLFGMGRLNRQDSSGSSWYSKLIASEPTPFPPISKISADSRA
jgi:hypothetical protein